LHPERGEREGDENSRRTDHGDERMGEDTVEDPAPGPAALRPLEPVEEGHAQLDDPVTEPREERPQPFLPRTRRPERSAGRTVSEPGTAIATTRMVAIANEPNVLSPVRNMPAMAVITVRPEMRTERPEVAAAASRAALSLLPAARSSRSRFK